MNPPITRHLLAAVAIFAGALFIHPIDAGAQSASDIRADARTALNDLYIMNPKARNLGSRAVAVLVFPNITKGGFIIAGQRGKGALFGRNGTLGYFQSTAASYGFQAGIQQFGYALFFMS